MDCLRPSRLRVFTRWCCLGAALCAALVACGSESETDEDAEVDFRQNPLYVLNGEEAQILSVNFQIFSQIDFFRHIDERLFSPRDRTVAWAELRHELRFDPVRRVERVVIGFYGELNLDDPFADSAIVVTGDLGEPQKLLEKIIEYGKFGLLTDPSSIERSLYGRGSIYETQVTSQASGRKVDWVAAFPIPGLAIFSRSRERVTDCVDVIEARSVSITEGSYWKPHLERIDYSAVLWGAGDMPRSIVNYLNEKSRVTPTLAPFAGIGRAHSFYVSLESEENVFVQADLICDAVDIAGAVTRDLEISRSSVPQLVNLWYPQGSPKYTAWIETLDEILVSTIGTTTAMSLRLDDTGASEFLKAAIGEPTPTPPPLNIPPPFL